MIRPLVRFAYHLESAARYRRVKGFFYDLLESPRSRLRSAFDLSMIVLVTASVFLIIYEVNREPDPLGVAFEAFVVTVFIVEYLLRMWLYSDVHKIIIESYERAELINRPLRWWQVLGRIARSKWEYATSPLAIIDLLAILPSYRPLRFLRVFLLFRVFKLFRYAHSVNEFIKVLSEKRFDLLTLAIIMGFVVFTASTAIYFFEGPSEAGGIHGFFDAVYWAVVTISTVGYGDIIPQSTAGRLITLLLIISGIGVIAFSTSIIVAAFNEKIRELRENRIFGEIEKRSNYTLLCGYGRTGQVVARSLIADRERVVVVDRDPERVEVARRQGILALQGDAAGGELLKRIGLKEHVQRVLSLTGDDVANVYITLTAHHVDPEISVIARANSESSVKKLRRAGADHVVRPHETVGLIAAEYVGQPVAFDAIYGMISGRADIRIEAIVVHAGSPLDGRTVGDADLAAHSLILFGVIRSPEAAPQEGHPYYDLRSSRFYFNPRADFAFRPQDIIVVFGHELTLYHFKEQLERHGRRRWRKRA